MTPKHSGGLTDGGGPEATPSTVVRKHLLTVGEAAEYLSVTPKTIRNWVGAGTLPKVKVGRCLRLDQRALDRFLAASNVQPQP